MVTLMLTEMTLHAAFLTDNNVAWQVWLTRTANAVPALIMKAALRMA